MPPWWGKSSSKETTTTTTTTKKKTKENLMDTLHRFISPPSDQKGNNESKKKRSSYATSAKGSQSRAESRSTSPSNKNVSRCQSFSDRPHPLPLPHRPAGVTRTASEVGISRPLLEKRGKPQLRLPLPKPSSRPEPNEPGAGDFPTPASISSNCSVDSDDPFACGGSQMHSPVGTDVEAGNANGGGRIPRKNYVSSLHRDQAQSQSQTQPQPQPQPVLHQKPQAPRPTTRPISPRISAPNSLMSSPSRSPRRICPDQILPSAFFALRSNDVSFMGNSSGQGSPGSGQTSGHNSVGGDMLGQLLWQQQSLQSRGSPECSPLVSPRLMSPGPGSRIHSGNVSPLHPRAGGESPSKQTHRLPLPPPPVNISNNNNNSNNNGNGSFVNNGSNGPSRSPPPSPGSRWKKGKLLGRGTFGHVYVGFNSDSGEMCAMKEVTIFLDDPKSKESQKQLSQEIFLLSKLRHPNIVQYYGSETVEDRLYIYLEYVSGGSIHRLLQEYGQFGEPAIRSYTQQILSGLAYLHAKNTVHRDIKGANILVDPSGRVKLADFGMAKHISGQSCPFSFKGSPYWMAPEVIKNANGCNLAVDIWSLGCTVLEMATSKPPWSQYEGIAAMFKIGNSKELPSIPDHLSDEGKDFIRRCLQREPINRPSASDLLRHPFVQNATPIERFYSLADPPLTDRLASHSSNLSIPKGGGGHLRNLSSLGNEGQSMSIQQRRGAKITSISSDIHLRNNISCPVSPSRSPILRSRSPRNGQMSPSPISSPRTASGASTPLTGHLHFNTHFNHSNANYDGFVPSSRVQRVISESDILNPHYGNNTTTTNNNNGNSNSNSNRSNRSNGGNGGNGGNGLSRIRLNPALDLRPK